MAEGHRLRRLQMGEARHDRRRMGDSLLGERALQPGDLAVQMVGAVADIKPEIGRDLIVARARGVQPPGRLADQLLQPRFDIHVDIFQGAGKAEFPGIDLGFDRAKPVGDRLGVRLGNDAATRQHIGMSDRSFYVLGVEAAVEADGGVDFLHDFGGTGCEASAPHFVCHDNGFGSLK